MTIKLNNNFTTLIAGGTGGHIYPAIAILEEIKKTHKVTFITDKRGHSYLSKNRVLKNERNFEILVLDVISPFKKGLINKLKFLYFFIISIYKLVFFYLKNKPKSQIGFGGYTTILPCIIGKIFFTIKYFIHEQNSIMGRANKILEPLATNTFIPFDEITPSKHIKKRIFTGTPVRKDFKFIKNKKKDKRKLNILVFGGSLGSDFFSVSLVTSFINLSEKVKKNLFIFHQIKNSKIRKVKQLYRKNKVISEVKSFFPNIEKYYNKADLIICRAGGSSIAEILYLKKPSIIIPLKTSMDNHQEINSKIISKNKLGWVIDENDFKSDTLIKIIEDISIKNLYLKELELNLEKYTKINDIKKKHKSSTEIIKSILSKNVIKSKKNVN